MLKGMQLQLNLHSSLSCVHKAILNVQAVNTPNTKKMNVWARLTAFRTQIMNSESNYECRT